jgi:hypothetical protein
MPVIEQVPSLLLYQSNDSRSRVPYAQATEPPRTGDGIPINSVDPFIIIRPALDKVLDNPVNATTNLFGEPKSSHHISRD